MMLFHLSCPKWDKVSGPVPCFELKDQWVDLCTRTYVCDRCGDKIHVDMDWEEGATPEKEARID